jgi:DNA-directed RNA polymerase subunit RPC12/RpoP
MRKPLLISICLAFLFSCMLVVPALAQTSSELTISLHRDFGYSGFNDIQGTFTLKATGPADLSRVIFLIDSQVIAEVDQPPFQVRFNTGSYALGQHTLSATGYTSQGVELESNQIHPNFVSAEEGWQAALKIALPILAIGVGIATLAIVVPWLFGLRKPRQPLPDLPANYGFFGAAVCPKCGRPFARHWWGLNMMAGKLDRCPHCGKWSIVRRASPDRLQEAEDQVRQTIAESQEQGLSEEQRLKRDLDDSRFQDM